VGHSGRAFLFQRGQAALLEAYQKAPYPLSTVTATEVFNTGVLVSDTDYRQFVQYGQVLGLDLAYYQDGYKYHTMRDIYDGIAPGSIQHLGENSLETVYHFMKSDLLERLHLETDQKAVYFDLLGKIFITYPWNFAFISHYLLHAITLIAVFYAMPTVKGHRITLFVSLWIQYFLNFILCLLVPILYALIMSYGLGFKFLWFTAEWLPLVYFTPFTLFILLSLQIRFFRQFPENTTEKVAFIGLLLFMSTVMFITTSFNIMTSYLFAIWTCFLNLGNIIQMGFFPKVNKLSWIVYLVAFTLPLIYQVDLFASLQHLVVPLTSRLGYIVPADAVVGFIAGLITFFPLSIILMLFLRLNRLPDAARFFGVLSLLIAIGMPFLCQPHDKAHPRRIPVQHFYDFDSNRTYLYVASLDFKSLDPLLPHLAPFSKNPIEKESIIYQDDWDAVYPFSDYISSVRFETDPIVMPSEPRALSPLKLAIDENEWIETRNERRITLHCFHEHYSWTILRFNGKVLAWNIKDVPPIPQHGEDRYIIRQVAGYHTHEWKFSFSVEGNNPIKFELLGIRLENSTESLEVMNHFPDWCDCGVSYTVTSQSFTL